MRKAFPIGLVYDGYYLELVAIVDAPFDKVIGPHAPYTLVAGGCMIRQ